MNRLSLEELVDLVHLRKNIYIEKRRAVDFRVFLTGKWACKVTKTFSIGTLIAVAINLWVSGIYNVSPEFKKFYTWWLEKAKAIKNFVNFAIGKLPRY